MKDPPLEALKRTHSTKEASMILRNTQDLEERGAVFGRIFEMRVDPGRLGVLLPSRCPQILH